MDFSYVWINCQICYMIILVMFSYVIYFVIKKIISYISMDC